MRDGYADTVIVGAGSSGAVIARRMTERSEHQVMLLEAGNDYPDLSQQPDDIVDGTRNSYFAHDWGYRHTVNAKQAKSFPLPRGKVVGGSSSVNTCIALRGVPSDYDEWAAMGLSDWSWEQCLPAFKRLERDLDYATPWHGSDGPIPIRRHTLNELVPWNGAFLDACERLGLPAAPDHNAPDAEGYGPHPMNKIDGVRMNAARCYLTAAVRARPNLTIRPNVSVRRVLWQGRKAIGVEVEIAGVVRSIFARRVVLCAGAIATPGVLLRSGVGPSASVERIGVELVVENPGVGARLLDHPGAAFFLWPRKGVIQPNSPILQTALRFRSKGSAHMNDLQVQSGPDAIFPKFQLPLVSMMCHVGKPRGTGRFVYTSAKVDARPVIHSRLLDDPYDRSLAVAALRMAHELTSTSPMREMARTMWPPERVMRDDASLDGWIRQVCDSGYHPSGTVPMGADNDTTAATDAWGHVRGVEGLMVADASLMPTIPTANIHLPTLMLAERIGARLRDGEI